MDLKPADDLSGELEELVLAAQAGDRGALQQLWCQHRRWLAVILTAHGPRGTDVADLLQEVAVTMVTKIETLHDAQALRPWLRQVAINIARTAARRHRPMQRLGDAEPGGTVESAQADSQRGESYRRILQQMAELPLKYREPLMLRAIKDMSYQQIGEVLELPVTTVETRISRARRMLRELVADSPQPSPVGKLASAGGEA
jgi:RNA polymerase sigma-70 factor, ECF subfamily